MSLLFQILLTVRLRVLHVLQVVFRAPLERLDLLHARGVRRLLSADGEPVKVVGHAVYLLRRDRSRRRGPRHRLLREHLRVSCAGLLVGARLRKGRLGRRSEKGQSRY